MVFGRTILVLLLSSKAASAEPVPLTGTEALCAGLEETIEGVWQDQENDVLLFRLGLSKNGGACYATLNAYAPWGGEGGETFAASYSGTDPLVVVFPNRWKIEFSGDGNAKFVAGSSVAIGRWTKK